MSARHRPRPMPSALVRAAGAIVWRFADHSPQQDALIGDIIDPSTIEVLIVHRPRYNDWSWPKGKSEPGELLTAAAVREVEEETGEIVTLGAPLTVQRYRLGNGHIKEVRYWVGRVASATPAARVRIPTQRAPRKEIDDSRWVSPAEADAMLTRRGDRRLLAEVVSMAEKGTLVTEPLILMAHAEAVDPERWQGHMSQRHLSRIGVRQSLDAIGVLSAFGVARIQSSEWMCAHRTVAPYASAAGLPIRTHAQWNACEQAPVGIGHTVAEVVSTLNEATVVATHQSCLEYLIDDLRGYAEVDVRTQFPMEAPWLCDGELLIAHIAELRVEGVPQRRVIAVERHRVPPMFGQIS